MKLFIGMKVPREENLFSTEKEILIYGKHGKIKIYNKLLEIAYEKEQLSLHRIKRELPVLFF